MTQTRGWGQLMHQNGSTKPYATSCPVIPGPSVSLLPSGYEGRLSSLTGNDGEMRLVMNSTIEDY